MVEVPTRRGAVGLDGELGSEGPQDVFLWRALV